MKISKKRIEDFLKEWDKSSKSNRALILKRFIEENGGKTGPELESYFSGFASLFFARLTSWLRLTYMEATCLYLQLQSISIFVTATSGQKFVTDFIHVGGVQTILEILGQNKADEESKINVLQLLQSISKNGRSYKEFICKCHGIRAIAEGLSKSSSGDVLEETKCLMQCLVLGNPNYQLQVYNVLINMLKCPTPSVQHIVLKTLQFVQPIVGEASPAIVDPLLVLLRSLHVEVQHEVGELIKHIVSLNIGKTILQGLVSLLKPSELLALDKVPEYLKTPLPVLIQQCAAVKIISSLAVQNTSIASQLLNMDIIHHLLFALGNDQHAESQRHASVALEFFMRTFPSVDEAVKATVGVEFHKHFLEDPTGFCLELTDVQISMLRHNRTRIDAASNSVE